MFESELFLLLLGQVSSILNPNKENAIEPKQKNV